MENLSKRQKRELWILLVVVLALPATILAMQKIIELNSRADSKPYSVSVSKSINHFSIGWFSADSTVGKIRWGTSKNLLSNTTSDDRVANGESGTSKAHHVTIDTTQIGATSIQSIPNGDACSQDSTICVHAYTQNPDVTVGQPSRIYWNVDPNGNGSAHVFINDQEHTGSWIGDINVDTSTPGDKAYTIKGDDLNGQVATVQIVVSVSAAVCEAPTNASATVNGNTINLSWQHPNIDTVENFTVHRYVPYSQDYNAGLNFFYNLPNQAPGTYTYRIQANCPNGASNVSNEVEAIVTEAPAGLIGGKTFYIENGVETPITTNISLRLYNSANGQVVGNPVSPGGDGRYTFSQLPAGGYRVTVFAYDQTLYEITNTSKDVTLPSNNTQVTNVDFQFTRRATATPKISGFVWNDTNGNGIKDSGESNLSNITIGVPNTYTTAISDASGNYSIDNLSTGQTYHICKIAPANYVVTTPNSGCIDTAAPATVHFGLRLNGTATPTATPNPTGTSNVTPTPTGTSGASPTPTPCASSTTSQSSNPILRFFGISLGGKTRTLACPSASPSPTGTGNSSATPSSSASATPEPSEPPVASGFRRIYYLIESGNTLWGGTDVNHLIADGQPLYVDIPSTASDASPEADCADNSKTVVANCVDAAFGTITGEEGAVHDAIVTATITSGGVTSAPLTAITNANGRYVIDLGNTMKADHKSYLAFNRTQNDVLTLSVKAADGRTKTFTTTTGNDKPVQDIVLDALVSPSPSPSSGTPSPSPSSGTPSPSPSSGTPSPSPSSGTPSPSPSSSVRPSTSPSVRPSASPLGKQLHIIARMEGKSAEDQIGYAEISNTTLNTPADDVIFLGSYATDYLIPNLEQGKKYTFVLKGYQHLAVSRQVVIQPNITVVDFGTLPAGDVAPWKNLLKANASAAEKQIKALNTRSQAVDYPLTQDDLVEVLDYSTLKNNINFDYFITDINGNGITDIQDFSILKKNFEIRGAILKAKK